MITILDVLFNPDSPVMWIMIIAIIGGALAIIIRPFVTFAKFTYPNAKFESIGNPFVKEQNLQRFLELSDLQQFIDQINANKDFQLSNTNASDIQTALDHQFVETIQMMKRDSTKKMHLFYDSYLQMLDANLLKTAFKQFASNQQIDEDLSEQAVSDTIKKQLRIISKTEPEKMNSVLDQFAYPKEIKGLLSFEKDAFSSFALDAAIDKILLEQLQQTKVPYKCAKAKELYLKRLIDSRTIKHILRAKNLGYDGEHCKQLLIGEGYELAFWKQEELCHAENIKEVINKLEGTKYYQSLKKILDTNQGLPSIQSYTDAIDRYWLEIVRNLSTSFYTTIGPSLRFLEYKKIEIRNLKIITKGIAEHIPSKIISPLLITEEAI